MKRILYTALALMLCLCLFAVPALAAGTGASLTGPGTVRAGDTVTLTLSLEGSGISFASGTLEYDNTQLELLETERTIGNGWTGNFDGNAFLIWDDTLEHSIEGKAGIFTLTFKVKADVATGAAIRVCVKDLSVSDGSQDTPLADAVYSVSVAAPLSKDNNLKSLTVSNATISPSFSAGTTSYTAEVPFEVNKLQLSALASDGKAKVSVNNPELKAGGTTNVTVTVTAENGSKKTYTIAVTRGEDPNYEASSEAELSGITVDGFQLSPGFSPENTEYVIWLPYETESVTVSASAANGKANVTVEGGDNLTAGADNRIQVICTAEDGSQKIYTIVAKRAAAHGSAPTEPSEEPTEPSTEPGTQPEEEPTVPAPTQPQTPAGNENAGGISWWIVLIVAIVCYTGGILMDHLLLHKK